MLFVQAWLYGLGLVGLGSVARRIFVDGVFSEASKHAWHKPAHRLLFITCCV
jgi:hypothetical protein